MGRIRPVLARSGAWVTPEVGPATKTAQKGCISVMRMFRESI